MSTESVESGLRVRSAIEGEHVLVGSRAVDRDELIVVHSISHLAEAERCANARHQRCEAKAVATIQRQIDDAFVLNDVAERGALRFKRRSLPGDGHRFGRQSEFEWDINGKSQRDVQFDVVVHEALESGRLRLKPIGGRRQQRKRVITQTIADNRAGFVIRDVGQRNL